MDKITESASAALEQLRQLGIGPENAGSIVNFLPGRAASEQGGAVATFFEAVKNESAFAPLTKGWLQMRSMGMALQPDALAYGILVASMQGAKIEELIGHAIKTASEKRSSISTYVALCGIKVAQPIQLADTIWVLPVESVPDSATKDTFLGKGGWEGPFRPLATAFVKISGASRQIIFDKSPESPLASEDEVEAVAVDVVCTATCLTASTVAHLGSWEIIEDPGAQLLWRGTGYSWSASFNDMELMKVFANPSLVDPDGLTSLYIAWRGLPSSDAAALKIALKRLNLGLKRRDLVDKALDFGIALEVMLLHRIESTTELAFRFGVHGANFLGGSRIQRVATQRSLKDMYTLRSQAAHSGSLKSTDQKVRDTLDRAGELGAQIAKKIVLRGGFPDWTLDCVIGAD